MKRLVLCAMLAGFSVGACGQNDFKPLKGTSPSTTNGLWDLNKYVWSQTNPMPSKGDKPRLDFDAIDNWLQVGSNSKVSISRDGQYFAYGVERGIYNYKKDDSLIVQSTMNDWRQSFSGARPGFFSGSGKEYIFKAKHDLYFVPLGGDHPVCVKEVASYKLPGNEKNEWLAYQLNNGVSSLILRSLLTGKEKRFDSVAAYSFDESGEWLAFRLTNGLKELVIYNLVTEAIQHFQSVTGYSFDASGKVLILKTGGKTTEEAVTSLQYVSLPTGISKKIWSTADSAVALSNYSLGHSGRQVVFMVQKNHDNFADNSIWYYRDGMDKAILKAGNQTVDMDAGLEIQTSASFTGNDHYIQFSLQQHCDSLKRLAEASSVDVWSYRDSVLQSVQQHLLKEPVTYLAVLNPETGQITRLEKEYEKLCLLDGDFAVVKKSGKSINGDRFWEKDYQKDSNWLVSLKDGSRTLLPTRGGDYTFWFSPGGKYLVYFNADQQCNYFSYELQTGKLVNISASVPAWQLGYTDAFLRPRQQPVQPVGVAGWLEEDEALLVYDSYDIWQLDLKGKKHPVNITNGYGYTHHILFTLMGSDRNRPTNWLVFSGKDTILLRAFNRKNKYNGFYQKVLNSSAPPALLYMGPYFMVGPCFINSMSGAPLIDDGMRPLKATDVNTWIIKRQSATEAPNYFITYDFKTYKPLTNLIPHKGYNWVTAELHSFKQLDGTISQGVLYKPEDFNPAKKYPVIISFYTQLSDQLYQYPEPEYIECPDICDRPSWMASHGYLVFLPDVYFTKGSWGPSTVNTMDGAARYLSQLAYVDGKHIGAVGHSNSGRFGYYLLTHSHSFAAMSMGSGLGGTDIISAALSIALPNGYNRYESLLEWAEASALGAGGLGAIWQNKKLWIDHNAVLQADKVTTPLMLFHNMNDGDDVRLAIELFISLRRLEKEVWWLQYDNGAHRIWKISDLRDFTIRFTQFFDRYLNEAPVPRWMQAGVPAKLKGIESRFELNRE